MSDKPVIVEVFGRTDVGMARDHNEDSFLVADLTTREASLQPEVRSHAVGLRGTLFMVADGMGGAAAGELASEMATETVFTHMVEAWGNDQETTEQRFAYRLKEAVEIANARIYEYARTHPENRGMGTTTTATGVYGTSLFLTQIGDSRGYLIRQGKIVQITKDQSLMQRLVDAGELTEEEAAVSERRNIILQALGPDPTVKVDLTRQELCRGDMLVMCSDGLSGLARNEDILQVVTSAPDLVGACKDLIELANARGGPDNITCIVARFGGPALPEPDGALPLGHHVYPLLDTESTTEPVPVYPPEDGVSERKTEQVPERTTEPIPKQQPAPKPTPKKKWWPF
jgi:serine/threonine protein phosphatase PrpC